MTAPRIDSLRNRLTATRDLLTMVEQELEDLHVLAYDRPAATEEAKVSGGTSHYYLDTHGDQRARNAYKRLWDTLDGVCTTLDGAANNALNLLREGGTPTNQGPRTVRLGELGELIAAQARRARTADYTPHRRGPQPDLLKATEALRRERDDARRQLEDMTRQRDRALAERRRAG